MPGFFGRCPWTYSTKDCILRYACQCGCSSVDRVLASEAKGRWFDSSQPHQFGILPSRPPSIWRCSQRLLCSPVPPCHHHVSPVLLCLIDHSVAASLCCSSIILKSIAHDYNLCVALCMVSAKIPRLYCMVELMLSFDATVLTNLQGSNSQCCNKLTGQQPVIE